MTPQQKQNIWYIAVGIAVILLMVSEYFGASAIAFGPLLLVMVFVAYWAFDVK
jgi:hypothetical protein